jgi:muconolactone delta-isomerase
MDAFIAQCDYMDKLKSEGKITTFVPFSGINGGFFVANVPSNEELSRIISNCPMFPYVSREIYPLTEDSEAKKIISDMKKRMAPN